MIAIPFLGVYVILLSAIMYTVAWKKFSRGMKSLHFLIIGGLLLRVFCALDPVLHMWDERFHAVVAKHMMIHFLKPTLYEHPVLTYDYRMWNNNYIWLHKQPFALWMIALSLKIFGIHSWAVRVPSVVTSTIGIKLIWDVAERLYGKKIAFFSALLFSMNGLIIEIASGRTDTDHIDAIFLFLILLAIRVIVLSIGTDKVINHVLVGLILGLAILTKWLPALLVLPIWLVFNYSHYTPKKLACMFAVVIAFAALIALPWQIYIFRLFPFEASWEYNYNKRHLFEALEGHSGNWFYHFNNLRIQYGEIVYIAIFYYLLGAFSKRKVSDVAIALWFIIPFSFFSFAATKMPCYTLLASPAIFIITSKVAVDFWQNEKILNKLIASLLICLPMRYAIERVKPFENFYISKRSWAARDSRTVYYNAKNAMEIMFHTDATAYDYIIENDKICELKSKGFNVINANGEEITQ